MDKLWMYSIFISIASKAMRTIEQPWQVKRIKGGSGADSFATWNHMSQGHNNEIEQQFFHSKNFYYELSLLPIAMVGAHSTHGEGSFWA